MSVRTAKISSKKSLPSNVLFFSSLPFLSFGGIDTQVSCFFLKMGIWITASSHLVRKFLFPSEVRIPTVPALLHIHRSDPPPFPAFAHLPWQNTILPRTSKICFLLHSYTAFLFVCRMPHRRCSFIGCIFHKFPFATSMPRAF